MTTEEKQEIINAVLSAIRTNSKTITQLTPVTEMSDDDYIELSGGRRVAYPVLMAILDTYVTDEEMSDAMLGTADLDSNQVLDWKQSPIVFLESMGADYDDIDGGTLGFNPNDSAVPVGVVYYSPHSGFQIFEKTGESTFLGYLAKTGVCYVNKNTRRFYMWNGSDMVEIGNNKSMKVVIDDMNCSDLNDIAYEQVVYMPLTKKLVVKVGTRKWWSWTPNTNQLYCDKVNNTTLRWEPSSESFVTIGGGGGMSKAVYDAIKDNIEAIRTNFNSLSEQLANLAFKGANPQLSVDPFTWPSQGGSGGDEPVQTPTIEVSPSSLSFNTEAGQSAQQTFTVQGRNLTGNIQLSSSNNLFEVSPNSLSPTNGSVDATVTVTYRPNAAGTHSGFITISSTGASKTVPLSGTATAAGEASITSPTGAINFGTIDSGGSVTKSDIIIRGVNLNEDLTIEVTGSNFSTSVSSITKAQALAGYAVPIVFSGSNDSQHDVTKAGTLRIYSNEVEYSFDLIGKINSSAISTVNVVYKLLNFDQPSNTTQDQVFGYYKETVNKSAEFNKELTVIQRAASNNDLTVKSGGVVKYKYGGSNNATGYAFSDGTLTITAAALALLTDDLIIEATAYTGKVTIAASEAVSGGVTINGGSAQNLESGSNEFSVNTISSLSFASGAKAKITSIDFGGAQFTGTTLESMFSGFTALTQVKGLVVTGSVNTLAKMFKGCTSLQVFDTIGWDTSAVTTIAGLAYKCSALTKVDLGSKDMGALVYAGDDNANTDYPTDETVFSECTSLASLDVSHWNVPHLVSLWGFLYKCTSLESFDASTWKNATNIWNLHGMFASCSALTEIDISGIDTSDSNVTPTISHMFDTCRNLTDLTIKNFDMSRVTDISSIWWAANRHITLHCKSSDPETCALNATDSLNWIKEARSNSTSKGFIEYIKVPVGSRNSYLSNTGWAAFSSIISEE